MKSLFNPSSEMVNMIKVVNYIAGGDSKAYMQLLDRSLQEVTRAGSKWSLQKAELFKNDILLIKSIRKLLGGECRFWADVRVCAIPPGL